MSDFSIPVFDFLGHQGQINAICLSDEGQIFYAVEDQSIRIWDIAKKKMVHVLSSINLATKFLKISSNGKLLAAGDEHGFIELWNLTNFTRISRIQAYTSALLNMLFAEEEYTLITLGVSDTYLLKKFKLDTRKLILKLEVELDLEEEVRHAIITTNNKSVVTLVSEEMLFSKFKNFKIIHEFEHEDIKQINSSLNRDSLFGITKDGLLKIWELKKLKVTFEMQIPMDEFQNEITHTALDSVRGWLIFGNHNKIWIWDIQANELLRGLKVPKSQGTIDSINCFVIDPLEDRLIIGGSKSLRIVDINTGKNLQSIRRKPISPPYYSNFRHSHLSRDHNFIVTIRKLIDKTKTKEVIEVWDVKTRERKHEIFPEMEADSNITSLTISPDAKFFVTGDDSKVSNGTIWNLKTGKVRKKLKELDYGVNSIIVSEDSSLIITSDNMFDIEMFDAKTGKYLKKISSATKNVSSFTLTKDNSTLVCAFRDVLDREFDIIIWNVQTGDTINRLSAEIGWEDGIIDVEYSKNEKELIARSNFGYLVKWDTKSWKMKEKTEGTAQKLAELLKENAFVHPFAENLILNVSDREEITPPIQKFLKLWLEKPTWISKSNDVFSLISEIPEDEEGTTPTEEIENLIK